MNKRVFTSLLIVSSLILAGLLNACAPRHSALQKVLDSGKLEVVTRNAPTTFYNGPHGPAGMEYDLLKAFADELGVELVIHTAGNLKELLDKVSSGEVAIAAAGLTVTEERKKRVRFTPAYQEITQQVVYHANNLKAESIADLNKGHLEIVANSSHVEALQRLQQSQADLSWVENDSLGSTELLKLVADQVLDFTVADSNEIKLNRRYYPDLKVAFDISEPQSLAWAMPLSEDDSLYREAVKFFQTIKTNGELAHFIKRNYGHMRRYDYAGTPTYLKHTQFRLPRYRQLFEQAANSYQLDWRFLAAMAYQESHWNPRAVSPTGVRGMMMLTTTTAKQLGVTKRTDPKQSIHGGAKYFTQLLERLDDIPEPDRTWFALAAYNVGLGHVRDAQWIAEQKGLNPNKWTDIKETLPLLRQRKWYSQTRYGYARGYEPVRYVENIRSYYDILRWHIEKETPRTAPASVLAFTSPVL
ncbi:MAG: membrane-bound lytic murein transglycosylase MltF [Thioalkalispiraceae bacterium]|jgi:membrane-bound lytic murein transglycosylase F